MNGFDRLLRAFAPALIILFALPAFGAEGSSAPSPPPSGSGGAPGLAVARALVDAGRFEEALAVLRPLLEGGEGRGGTLSSCSVFPAVQASQRPGLGGEEREALLDGAIASFRAMLVDRPELVRVRLELARAFFLKGEDSLARRHFERVLAGGVPETVAANVRMFLLQLRARRRWDMHVGAAIAPDSNIGGGSDERTIYIYGLPFQRDAEELTSSGVGLVLWGGGEYHYPLDDRTRLRAGGNLWRREHGGSQFDEASAAVHLGPRILLDERTEASVLATASQRWAGTVKDFHGLGGRIEASRRLSRSVSANGRLSWEDRHYRSRDVSGRRCTGPVARRRLGRRADGAARSLCRLRPGAARAGPRAP